VPIFYNWAVTPWFHLSADAMVRPFNGGRQLLPACAQFKFF
jgi:hypothetical protein